MRDTIAARVSASWIPGTVRRWAEGKSWEAKDREIKPDATVHPSVADRFALPSVVQCDGVAPYRPAQLAKHVDYQGWYASRVPLAAPPEASQPTAIASWRPIGRSKRAAARKSPS